MSDLTNTSTLLSNEGLDTESVHLGVSNLTVEAVDLGESELELFTGDNGISIQSIEQTTTSTEDQGENIITVTLTNGLVSHFVIRNGSKGPSGAEDNNGTFLVWRSETDSTPSASTEPESMWTTDAVKMEHVGDIYLNSEGLCWEYKYVAGLGYYWGIVTDSYLIQALNLAKSKSKCVRGEYGVDTPSTGAYDVNDLWVDATYGTMYSHEMLVCISSGNWGSFSINHWRRANSYSAQLSEFITTTYKDYMDNIQSQIDQKAESWKQDTDPSLDWTTEDERNMHTGDIWYDTVNEIYKIWNGTSWDPVSADLEGLIDLADGKSSIYGGTVPGTPYTDTTTGDTKRRYKENDLWILPQAMSVNGITYARGTILAASSDSDDYVPAHWSEKIKYTDGMNDDDRQKLANAGIDLVNGTITVDSAKFKINATDPSTEQVVNLAIFELVDGMPYLRTSFIRASELEVTKATAQKVVTVDENGTVLSTYNGNGNGTIVYYYPNGNKMKEDVFIYDAGGNITGVKTHYYNSDGTLRWWVNDNGETKYTSLAAYWEPLGFRTVIPSSDVSDIFDVAFIVGDGRWNTKVDSSYASKISTFHVNSSDAPALVQYDGLTCYGNLSSQDPSSQGFSETPVEGFVTMQENPQSLVGTLPLGYYFAEYTDGKSIASDEYFVTIDGGVYDSEGNPITE